MRRILKIVFVIQLLFALQISPAHAKPNFCRSILELRRATPIAWVKKKFIDGILKVMAKSKGLPKYIELVKELERTGDYDKYANFGEMGLAEMGISVRYNQAQFDSLKTGRPLIIVANHHLGIADGLAMQYIAGRARTETPSLLFLARWIEKLMPFAVYREGVRFGTAIPVEINGPKEADPDYKKKFAEMKTFNSEWGAVAFNVLKKNGADIIFPAGHVSLKDEPDSWQDGFLKLARLAKADIVFAHVDSVNSDAFYKNRKRFGGGDLERVIWFLSEALAKKDQFIDVYLSKPMSLDEIYDTLSNKYPYPREQIKSDRLLAAELMRQFTYQVSEVFPQTLDTPDSPRKKTGL